MESNKSVESAISSAAASIADPLSEIDPATQETCLQFAESRDRPRFLFGRNVYADCIVNQLEVEGFIDDFTEDETHLGKPIVKLNDVPKEAIVGVMSGGRPFTALDRVREAGLDCVHYFSLIRHSGLDLDEARFNEGFDQEFSESFDRFQWIHDRLEDERSRREFTQLIQFKRSYDLRYLQGFTAREHEQYFEDFLELETAGESFADVGAYDGVTSEMFIHRCPEYRAVHIFEPGEENRKLTLDRLAGARDVHIHPVGLSDRAQTLRFSQQGSSSRISDDGEISIEVRRMDDVLDDAVTFIKMDIEGAEFDAIDGARETISKYRPRLAIGVYHRPADIWRIPARVLEIRDDYRIRLRHYTESIYETVMFFL